MSVAILGGRAKGFSILIPKNVSYRPTSVMLRRKFFDQKQNWENLVFLDLCAGSGVMGLEALSRGAKKVIFNDYDSSQIKVLKKNFEHWCVRFPQDYERVSFYQGDGLKVLKELNIQVETWIFFDPPYDNEKLYQKFIIWLKELKFNPNIGIIIEYTVKGKKTPAWWEDMMKLLEGYTYREVMASDRRIVSFKGENNV